MKVVDRNVDYFPCNNVIYCILFALIDLCFSNNTNEKNVSLSVKKTAGTPSNCCCCVIVCGGHKNVLKYYLKELQLFAHHIFSRCCCYGSKISQ